MNRRDFLTRLAAAGLAAGAIDTTALVSYALAKRRLEPGIRKVIGEVRVNDALAMKKTPVGPGDAISTGADGLAVFVVGGNAFLLRAGSRVELVGNREEAGVVRDIVVRSGKLLSVFERGGRERRIITPTATAGVRGTGAYVEASADITYLCTCYGEVDLESTAFPGTKETLKTKHHEAPRYVLGACAGSPIIKAPMMNHTDAELIMLEALVDRKPPFAGFDYDGPSGY